MKKKLLIFALIFMGFSLTMFSQTSSASASASTEATIITPISISKIVDLNFGNIVTGTVAGDVVVDVSNTRSATGGVILPSVLTGVITSANFLVTGQPNATYNIQVPSSFTINNLGNSMTVGSFITNPSSTGLLDNSGQQNLSVGATLNVNPNQPSGVYFNSSDLTITVAYN
jgi:hypothetical protein